MTSDRLLTVQVWGGTAWEEMLCDIVHPPPAPAPPPPAGACSGVDGHFVCGCHADGGNIELSCADNGNFTDVKFASIGTPVGGCGNMTQGACHGDPAIIMAAVRAACVGKMTCTLTADIQHMNGGADPCVGVAKSVYVELVCSTAAPPLPPAPPPPSPPPPAKVVPCMMEVDGKIRESCGWDPSDGSWNNLGSTCGILQCGGKVGVMHPLVRVLMTGRATDASCVSTCKLDRPPT
jgi:hypothetical protein